MQVGYTETTPGLYKADVIRLSTPSGKRKSTIHRNHQ
jgi:hypothetical protein